MASSYFKFKQFTIFQDRCAFKVGTDGVLLGACADVSSAESILDIGTGTGLVAIMIAQRSSKKITAIEPDQDSFEQAVFNVRNCIWADRIMVENTDLQNFDPGSIRFDLIVTNPPFFTGSLKNPDMRKAAARHNDSLPFDDLLAGVSRVMADNGRFHVIMPYAEGNIFIAEAQRYGLYCNSLLKIKPLPSSEVRRMIMDFSGEKSKPHEKFLTIEHGRRHEFTKEYIELTKEFYLNF